MYSEHNADSQKVWWLRLFLVYWAELQL